MASRNSSPKPPPSAEEVRQQLQSDWFETSRRVGVGTFIDRVAPGCDDTVTNAISGKNTPRLHTALASLNVDTAALFNTLMLYGVVAVPADPEAISDMDTISAMLRSATEYLERMQDGKRCHVDTAALAKLFKPLVPAMLAIIREANGFDAPAGRLRAVGG